MNDADDYYKALTEQPQRTQSGLLDDPVDTAVVAIGEPLPPKDANY